MPPLLLPQSLSALIHGPAKAGKSTIGVSTKPPRVLFDVEMGAQHLPIRPIAWDPKSPPPKPSPDWDTAVVVVRTWSDLMKGLERLESTPHGFNSMTLDSAGAAQRRLIKDKVGIKAPERGDWGEFLRAWMDLSERMRDLVSNGHSPMTNVVMLSPTRPNDQGMWAPMLQGQARDGIPYIFDLTGYLFTKKVQQVNPQTKKQELVEGWFLRTRRTEQIEAGQRVQGKIPETLRLPTVTGTRAEVNRNNRIFEQLTNLVYADLDSFAPPATSEVPPTPAPPAAPPAAQQDAATATPPTS